MTQLEQNVKSNVRQMTPPSPENSVELCPPKQPSAAPFTATTQLCHSIKQALSLRYDARQKTFAIRLHGEASESMVTDNALLAILGATNAACSNSCLFALPENPRRLLPELRRISRDDLEQNSRFNRFIQSELVLQSGADVTSEEIWQRYEIDGFCNTPCRLNRRDFVRQLPNAIVVVFSIRKRHDIKRPDASGNPTDRNGWAGLALRDAGPADGTDAPDVSDTPDI
jgi:hypothetical protein